MTTGYQIAFNHKNYDYEVHAAGCKHLNAKHLETMGKETEAHSGAEVKEAFEAGNDGCYATLGPCAR